MTLAKPSCDEVDGLAWNIHVCRTPALTSGPWLLPGLGARRRVAKIGWLKQQCWRHFEQLFSGFRWFESKTMFLEGHGETENHVNKIDV